MGYSTYYRLCFIDQIIRSGDYPSKKRLAKELEVSVRTIYRDLEYLENSLGAPLDYDSQKKGYYYKETTWRMPAILFTEQELLSLLIAKNALLHYIKIPYFRYLLTAFEKIIKCLPDGKYKNLDDMEDYISFRFGAIRNFNPYIMEEIVKSLRRKYSVKIRYHSVGKDEETERVVDPYHLDNLRGDWYLIGFCHLRNDIRVFSLNRILECYMLDKKFEIDPDFSHEDFIKDAFGIIKSDKKEEVKILFRDLEARLVKERVWHSSQKIEELDDGSVVISMDLTGFEEIKKWVLSAGKDAEVLKPDWFRKEIAEELSIMSEIYRK